MKVRACSNKSSEKAYSQGVSARNLLDHDLGGTETGYDLLCMMERGEVPWPKHIKVISWNPAGRIRMTALLRANGQGA